MAPELLKAQSLYPSADKVPDSVFLRFRREGKPVVAADSIAGREGCSASAVACTVTHELAGLISAVSRPFVIDPKSEEMSIVLSASDLWTDVTGRL